MVLVHFQVVRQLHHQAEGIDALPLQFVADEAHDAQRPGVVVRHSGCHNALKLRQILSPRRPGDAQGPGVRHGAVRPTDAAVATDLEKLQDLLHGLHVLLRVGVGFEQVEEYQVGAVLAPGVEDVAIGNGHLSLPVDCVGYWPVPGEVEIRPRRCQLAKLLGVEVGLKLAQCHGADAAGIHPGHKEGEDVGVFEFREGFLDFKCSDFHNDMVAQWTEFGNSQCRPRGPGCT